MNVQLFALEVKEVKMDNLLNALGLSESDMLHKVIGNTFIVEMGIIKDIPSDGIVTVEMSVATAPENIMITNCVLVNTASSSFSVNIKPNIDDKVIVLFPRKFAGAMFNPEENEPIISEAVIGYSLIGGIAILMNQYQEDYHKNSIDISDGKIKITTQKDVNIEINKDKEISIDTGKAKVSIDKDGNVTIDAMSGKISLKNSQASLFDILDGMLNVLNNTLSTSGSPSKHIVDPNQFQQQATQLGQLMQ